jgi:protein-S-isoprenylcysteine O-methyltransferase Ste14
MKNGVTTTTDNPGVIARPPVLYGGAFLVVLALRWFWPMPIAGPAVIPWLGLPMLAVGIGVAVWGRRALQAGATNVDPMLPTTAIVTSGPFRFSRNPLYLALTLIYFGLTLLFKTWWGLALLVPLLIVMHRGVVMREERYLMHKFGETYRQYRSKVRRYF